MNKRFEILQGEGKQSYTDRLLRVGGFVIGFTKGTVRFGIDFTTELGDVLMYSSGQEKYAIDLKHREPRDRVSRELKTAVRAFTKKSPDIELGKFAARYVVSGIQEIGKRDFEQATSQTGAIVDLIESMPNTAECAEFAEEVTARGLEPVVDTFNQQVSPFPGRIPAPRSPEE